MNPLDLIFGGNQFIEFIKDIFSFYDYTIIPEPNIKNTYYDFSVEKENMKYLIEVKYFRNGSPNPQLLIHAIEKVYAHLDTDCSLILITNSLVNDSLRNKLQTNKNIIILDIQNILYIIDDIPTLKSKLLSILDFTVTSIIPKQPNLGKIFTQTKILEPTTSNGIKLKQCIINWSTTNSNIAYENMCTKVLNYLFDDELTLWHTQEKSNSDLYRFDLICKIKDGDISGFWTTLVQFFNSKYIIFEFKNYNDKITQKEIYTTDKYLYLKALRSVAIIISCKGASTNANKAIRGTLRENGKLILSISNEDMIKMIEMKLNNELPSDYLYSKFDELMIDLEK